MATGGLKRGEKVLFGVVAAIGALAVLSFVAMEVVRAHMDKPMYGSATHFDFSEEGKAGSAVFRYQGCTTCHRAVRNGTNMGLDLDGIGSKRSLQYLVDFLKNPEATYGTQTVDHGPGKAAAYVAERLSDSDRHALAVFLSELRATQGSADARLPPEGKSEFIDTMVKEWAPDDWKAHRKDLREEANAGHKEEQSSAASK